MIATIATSAALFGVHPPLRLKGFPKGKKSVEMDFRDWVRVIVETKDGVRVFLVREEGGFWVPSYELTRKGQIPDDERPTFRAFAGRSVLLALGLWVLLWILLKVSEFLPFVTF